MESGEDKLLTQQESKAPEPKFLALSVSEWFKRNKSIAGLDNPVKQAYSTVRELVENSIPYEEPILIREDGVIRVSPIGEFVEAILRKGHVNMFGGLYGRVEGRVEALTIDEDLKVCFRPIKSVFKHKVSGELWRIEAQRGREVTTTSAHNVFIFDEGGLRSVPTKELKVGQHLVLPNKPLKMDKAISELNLVEELLKLPPSKTSNIVLHGIAGKYPIRTTKTHFILSRLSVGQVVSYGEMRRFGEGAPSMLYNWVERGLLERVERGRFRVLRTDCKRVYTIPRDWVNCDYVPFNYFRRHRVPIDGLVSVGVKQGRHTLSCTLSVTPELMRVLGYFSSEGCVVEGHKVTFSFSHDERETLAKDLISCFEKAFGVRPSITKCGHESAINVVVNSSIHSLLFKEVLKTGTNSMNVRVPWLAFNVDSRMAEHYLWAYASGDGYRGLKYSTLATSSEALFDDLKFLLTLLGKRFTLSFQNEGNRVIQGKSTRFKKSFTIYLRNKEGQSEVDRAPVSAFGGIKALREVLKNEERGKTNLYRPTVGVGWLRQGIEALRCPQALLQVLEGDVGFMKIRSIERVKAPGAWVYDISVDEVERFVGGKGIFLLHNSLDSCESMGQPPNIFIRISSRKDHYLVEVRDNGYGVPNEKVPEAFCRLLFGSKFGLKQQRGELGVGGKLVMLMGYVDTGEPFTITTATPDDGRVYKFKLGMDFTRNEPIIYERKERPNGSRWHGLAVKLKTKANFDGAMPKVKEYLRLTRAACPHARIRLVKDGEKIFEARRLTRKMPKPAEEVKYHPYGIDADTLKQLIKQDGVSRSFRSFLARNFQLGRVTAKRFVKGLRLLDGLDFRSLGERNLARIAEKMKSYGGFPKPDTSSLSPITEPAFLKGVRSWLEPDFASYASREGVFGGHAFVVEVALAYGGKVPVQSSPWDFEVYRFANKIPLLYERRSCLVTKVIESEDFRRYRLEPDSPVAFFGHVCSTHIPHKTAGKEYVGEVPEIARALDLAVKDALRRLSLYLSLRRREEERQRRRSIFETYIPLISENVAGLTGEDKKRIARLFRRAVMRVGEERGSKEDSK